MKPSTLIGCVMVCAAAVSLSSADERVCLDAKSVPTVLPEATFDVTKPRQIGVWSTADSDEPAARSCLVPGFLQNLVRR